MSFQRGDRVRILKGTRIHSMRCGWYECKRTYVVTVHSYSEGYECEGQEHPAEIIWPGTGGYWCRVDASEVERA